jgi:hypothetical protein
VSLEVKEEGRKYENRARSDPVGVSGRGVEPVEEADK